MESQYFVTCARGLERYVAAELKALPAAGQIKQGRGGVYFAGGRDALYAANLWLRTAVRVLKPVLEAETHSPDQLYEAVRTVDWREIMTPDHTLAVDCNVRDSKITHSQYASRRVKDAICDQFRDRYGRRPSVDPKTPMVPLNLHVYKNRATLSLDSSADSLHKRGYRPHLTRAPLNEALAAGLLAATGWDGGVPLCDPLCGSGVLPIEAAWIALKRPPGLTRKRFGFTGWLDFDRGLWSQLREEARDDMAKTLAAPIAGSDVRRDAVTFAENNAKAAGVGHLLAFARQDIADFRPPEGPAGVLISNPPYGERLGEVNDLIPLYQTIGKTYRDHCGGWAAFLFASDPKLAAATGLKPSQEVPFFNGKIECRLLRFDL